MSTKKQQEETLKNEEMEQPTAEETTEQPTVEPENEQENSNEWEEKYNQLNDSYLRLRAEFDNYRKRAVKEKAELLKSAGESLLVNILPLVDDFERGLQASEKAEDVTAVRDGLQLIYDKFLSFLSQNGVKPIEAAQQPFNTDFHEAITTIPAPTEDLKGKVVDCVQKGYTLNEKVIRFSKVVVGE